MPDCYFCKDRINELPYRCTFCGMIFCGEDRLPENHKCPFDLRNSSEIEDSINKSQVFYQDALDFIDKDLTVAKIYNFVTTRKMSDNDATELLSHFLENSEETEIRINSIMAFKVLELKNKNVFNILESCILSDENPEVKKAALTVIEDLFPKKSKDIRIWVKKQK